MYVFKEKEQDTSKQICNMSHNDNDMSLVKL